MRQFYKYYAEKFPKCQVSNVTFRVGVTWQAKQGIDIIDDINYHYYHNSQPRLLEGDWFYA